LLSFVCARVRSFVRSRNLALTHAFSNRCAYVNGQVLPDDVFIDALSTAAVTGPSATCEETAGITTCDFFDTRGVAADNRKRLYCIRQFFCGAGACGDTDLNEAFTTTRCTTALAFDGTPADIIPTYSIREGVKVSLVETRRSSARLL